MILILRISCKYNHGKENVMEKIEFIKLSNDGVQNILDKLHEVTGVFVDLNDYEDFLFGEVLYDSPNRFYDASWMLLGDRIHQLYADFLKGRKAFIEDEDNGYDYAIFLEVVKELGI
jgi:hypothetical protein